MIVHVSYTYSFPALFSLLSDMCKLTVHAATEKFTSVPKKYPNLHTLFKNTLGTTNNILPVLVKKSLFFWWSLFCNTLWFSLELISFKDKNDNFRLSKSSQSIVLGNRATQHIKFDELYKNGSTLGGRSTAGLCTSKNLHQIYGMFLPLQLNSSKC